MPKPSFQNYLRTPHKAILTLHLRPDMDAVGSNLALAHVLTSLGSSATIYSEDPVPKTLLFLLDATLIKVQRARTIPWKKYDIFWALDQASLSRMGETELLPQELTIVNIDHHVTNPLFGTLNIVRSKAPSTSSILVDLFKKHKVHFSKVVAQCLLTGIVGDTGFFRFVNDPCVFTDAAALMKQGALYEQIPFHILQHASLQEIHFLSQMLSRAVIKKKCVFITIPHTVWQECEKSDNTRGMVIGYLQSVEGTNLGVLLLEEGADDIRVELRARNHQYDVARLATKFGGGGHPEAAGCRLHMSLRAAEQLILKNL